MIKRSEKTLRGGVGLFFFTFLQSEARHELPEDIKDAFAAAKGDVTAFERIVRKYEKYVCTTVFGVLRHREDSFDVAQEVFLKLYHSIGSFKGDSSFSSWLYRIAKNTALDHLRREKKRRTVSLTSENDDGEEVILDIPDESVGASPEKALLTKERVAILYEALDKLSDEHREIITLRDINGYTYEEVAQMLDIEIGTVKSRLFRAREQLKKILEQKNYF